MKWFVTATLAARLAVYDPSKLISITCFVLAIVSLIAGVIDVIEAIKKQFYDVHR